MNFDLEKARAGEPIEYQEAYGWIEIPFIGVWDSEHVVCKAPWNDKPEIVHVSKLRMAKKREVMRYRCYVRDSLYSKCGLIEVLNDHEAFVSPEKVEEFDNFIKWVHHDWQEYEIGANDE